MNLTHRAGRTVSHYLVVGRRAIRLRRRLHGGEAERSRRADGHRAGAHGANVNFVAFGSPWLNQSEFALGLDGQLIALFVIVLAAAEAAVALAITLAFYNNHATIDVDRADELKG